MSEASQNFLSGLSIDDAMQIYYNISAEPNSMTVEQLTAQFALLGRTTVNLGGLKDQLSELQKAYDLSKTAQEEMKNGDGLSVGTITSLAEAEEDYLDFLYEENGVIKLNTEEWKRNADAKVSGTISSLESEIDRIDTQNDGLRENIRSWRERQAAGDTSDDWAQKIKEGSAQLEANADFIEKCKIALEIFKAVLNQTVAEEQSFADQAAAVKAGIAALKSAFDELNKDGKDITLTAQDLGVTGGDHAHDEYAPKESPVFTGSISMGRKDGSEVGDASVVEGSICTASGQSSHAEGWYSTASELCCHAEGFNATASGMYAHSEGRRSIASGECSHAECAEANAGGDNSHAEGFQCTASGQTSHVEGSSSIASEYCSHAEGQ